MSFSSHRLRALAAQVALAAALATLGAPLTHASAAKPHLRHAHHQVRPSFNPQPDPPGVGPESRPSFNPQPDPPGVGPESRPSFNPQPDPPGVGPGGGDRPSFNPQPDAPG